MKKPLRLESTKAAGDMMASREQRRRWRRKKGQRGKPMAVDSCWLVNVEKRPAEIERLPHKYMQKCIVESSTESESDANIEVISNSMVSEGSVKETSHPKHQFLDPYDGDYEDISGTSDCSLESFADMRSHSREILRGHPIVEALTPASSFLLEGQEPFPASPHRVVSTTGTQEDELDQHETCQVLQLQREPSWLSGTALSKQGELSKNTAPASALQPMLMECDNRVYEDPNTCRKQGRPVLENAGEKLRKKLRVT